MVFCLDSEKKHAVKERKGKERKGWQNRTFSRKEMKYIKLNVITFRLQSLNLNIQSKVVFSVGCCMRDEAGLA